MRINGDGPSRRSIPGGASGVDRRLHGSGSVTFASMNRARSPSSEARASPFAALRSAITTDGPRSYSARAVAAPSPDAPPATSALSASIFIGAAQ